MSVCIYKLYKHSKQILLLLVLLFSQNLDTAAATKIQYVNTEYIWWFEYHVENKSEWHPALLN